jgi:hypothetical protein
MLNATALSCFLFSSYLRATNTAPAVAWAAAAASLPSSTMLSQLTRQEPTNDCLRLTAATSQRFLRV